MGTAAAVSGRSQQWGGGGEGGGVCVASSHTCSNPQRQPVYWCEVFVHSCTLVPPSAGIEHCVDNGCEHGCVDDYGRYRCVCRQGYRLAADQHNCSGRTALFHANVSVCVLCVLHVLQMYTSLLGTHPALVRH